MFIEQIEQEGFQRIDKNCQRQSAVIQQFLQHQTYQSPPKNQYQPESIQLSELLSTTQHVTEIKPDHLLPFKSIVSPQLQQLSSTYPLRQNAYNLSENQILKRQLPKAINEIAHIQVALETNKINKTIFSSMKTYPVQNLAHQESNFQNKQNNISKLTKSLMTYKINNSKQQFHKAHLKTQSSCLENIEQRVQYQINKQLSSTFNGQKPIKSLNFPLISNEDHKKMNFQQLFSYEKKKMHDLKRMPSQAKTDESFNFEDRSTMIKNEELKGILDDEYNIKNLWNRKIHGQNNKFMIRSDSKKSYLLHPIIKEKNFSIKNQKIQFNPEKLTDSVSASASASSTEKVSIQQKTHKDGSNMTSNQKTIFQNNNNPKTEIIRRKKASVSLVTTFNFDYIRKENIQKSQIKQLGRKYLQSSKKKLNKQISPLSNISIVNFHGSGQISSQIKQNKLLISKAQIEKTLDSQRKLFILKKNKPKIKVKVKQIKQKWQKHNTRNYKTLQTKRQKPQKTQLMTFHQKFEPWQHQNQNNEQIIFPNDFEQLSY